MKRRLFNLLAAVSLVLCVAMLLWVTQGRRFARSASKSSVGKQARHLESAEFWREVYKLDDILHRHEGVSRKEILDILGTPDRILFRSGPTHAAGHSSLTRKERHEK